MSSSNHLQNTNNIINNQMIQPYQNNLYHATTSASAASSSSINQMHLHQQQLYHNHYHQPPPQQQQYHQVYQQQMINQHSYIPQQQQQQQQKPNNLNLYYTLLGLAEKFRQTSNYRLVIHCLESILTIKPAIETNLIIDVHFNLCKYYLKYTTNSLNLINTHLEKAAILLRYLKANDEYRYEATYLIYKFHHDLNQKYPIDLLRESLQTAIVCPIWYLRLLFLIGDYLVQNKDYNQSAYYMKLGIDYCAQNNIKYTHILFILSKGLIHLLDRNTIELQQTMQPCAALIENHTTTNLYQIESLKVFFLTLQVTYFIQCGQMKSVRNTLKSLQHYVQSLSNRNEEDLITNNQLDNFHWLEKDHLGILVFLLTIIHSMQSGCLDKAQKFSEKAFSIIDKLKTKQSSNFVLKHLNLLLLENVIRCRISMGNRKEALKEINDSFQICKEEPKLFNTHSTQLHILLGLYSLSMNCFDAAESQFGQVLRTTNDTELWIYGAFNLALVYLYSNKFQNLFELADRLSPDRIQTQNTAYSSCSHFLLALKLFCRRNYQEAQQSLRESILLANSEDILSISANGFLIMGHINFLLNLYQDSYNMLVSGHENVEKLPDINLRIYATLLLKTLYGCCKDSREIETSQKHSELTQILVSDYYEACKMPQHSLISWNDNSQPSLV